ncbi:hypothetical protein [Paenibacillus sp. CF384]|uniref:hypothetical protein n=1 Tax=Paenibacillus sp. CF384 TaxID=1884382 RepID=UPI00089B7BF9|nr:hypothetical protein [Paenibacillus sp. CF384]SDX50486.1 hypothetical protein SAMN05518855_101585 [Paenibacillus sp. CF384]
MANVHVMLWFDTEDYITKESEDALLAVVQMLNKRGVKGIFKIVGEKARKLERNNRLDIIEQLAQHEIGYHTDWHSVHPTVSEYLEHFGFADGAEEFDLRERAGLADVTRITGQTSKCYGQAGYSWAPQTFPVLRKWGIPVYLDVHDQITLDHNPFWYGGLLNLTDMPGIMRMELKADGLEEGMALFDRLYDELSIQDQESFISIYYHPCEFACTGFWDGVNYNQGHNTPPDQWQPAPLRQAGEMERYIEMLGAFIDYTRTKSNVNYITSAVALEMEKSNRNPLHPSDVRAIAAGLSDELNYTVYRDYSLSASEIHALFCRYLLGQELIPELIYGPENETQSDPSEAVRVADIKKAISEEYPRLLAYKQLPDYFTVAGYRINPVDLTCTLASIIANDYRDEDRIAIVSGVLKSKEHARTDENWGPQWSPFPPDLKVPNLIRLAQLQTWTLKPALF